MSISPGKQSQNKQSEAVQIARSQMVWDLPVRIFHWSLAGLFLVAWLSSEGDRWLDIHVFSGYAIAGLILFRMAWGFSGTYYARFRHFSYSLKQAKDYTVSVLKGSPKAYVGHNPAGSWAIYLLLGGLLMVVISGFFVFGAEEGHGLAQSLFDDVIGWLARNMHYLLALFVLSLVMIHIAGVFIESVLLREKLVLSMINGRKWIAETIPSVSSRKRVAGLLGGSLLVYFFSAGVGLIPGKEAFESQFTGKSLAQSDVWQEECGGCHLAYYPGLLPARSWQHLLQQQHQHFGEDLYLEKETINQLLKFALANAAESAATEASRKILRSISPSQTPLRISETGYWKHKHGEVAASVWKQSNVNGKAQCNACHQDAEQGWFEDSKMKIPQAPSATG